MTKKVFLAALILACLIQGYRWFNTEFVDDMVWAQQANYVETGNPKEFDTNMAYGHPGGPIIIGTAAIQNTTGISYHAALAWFMVLADGLIIALIVTLAYVLRRNLWWCIAILGTLSANLAYADSTPPSALAALLAVLFCLLTLYLYEQKDPKPRTLALWSLVSGLIIATRADIGVATSLAFGALLLYTHGWKRVVLLPIGAFAVFALFDPFMWFMPLQHMHDLIGKVVYHYAEYAPHHLGLLTVLDISFLALIGMGLGLLLLLLARDMTTPLPRPFLSMLLLMSAGLYGVFLTAHFQAERYFHPIIFIWEAFLPLLLFACIPKLEPSFAKSPEALTRFRRYLQIVIVAILALTPLVFTIVYVQWEIAQRAAWTG